MKTLKPAKKRICRKKNVDTKTLKLTLPEELYIAIKASAKNELRSLSQQIRFFVELGIEVFNAQIQQQNGEGAEQEEPIDAIGFKMEPEEDPEEAEEEEDKKPPKKLKK